MKPYSKHYWPDDPLQADADTEGQNRAGLMMETWRVLSMALRLLCTRRRRTYLHPSHHPEPTMDNTSQILQPQCELSPDRRVLLVNPAADSLNPHLPPTGILDLELMPVWRGCRGS